MLHFSPILPIHLPKISIPPPLIAESFAPLTPFIPDLRSLFYPSKINYLRKNLPLVLHLQDKYSNSKAKNSPILSLTPQSIIKKTKNTMIAFNKLKPNSLHLWALVEDSINKMEKTQALDSTVCHKFWKKTRKINQYKDQCIVHLKDGKARTIN